MQKTNNQGFSLVELIIVIAIMAVLVAVMAPSFLQYVERSRASTDMHNAAAIANAMEVWATDVNAGITPGTTAITSGSGTITVTSNGASVTGDLDDAIISALNNAALIPPNNGGTVDLSAIRCHARTTWNATQYSIQFTANADGSLTIDYTPDEVGGNASGNNGNGNGNNGNGNNGGDNGNT